MRLQYKSPGLQHSIESIMLFLEGAYREYCIDYLKTMILSLLWKRDINIA